MHKSKEMPEETYEMRRTIGAAAAANPEDYQADVYVGPSVRTALSFPLLFASQLLLKATASREVAVVSCLYSNLELPSSAWMAYLVQARATMKEQALLLSSWPIRLVHYSCSWSLLRDRSAEGGPQS